MIIMKDKLKLFFKERVLGEQTKSVDREKSIQEELAEDMMSLLASFSGKLYGIRSLEKRRKEEKENVKEE